MIIGIMFQKLFWPGVRKNCSIDLEKDEILVWRPRIWKFEIVEQFIRTEKVQHNIWTKMLFHVFPGGFSGLIH